MLSLAARSFTGFFLGKNETPVPVSSLGELKTSYQIKNWTLCKAKFEKFLFQQSSLTVNHICTKKRAPWICGSESPRFAKSQRFKVRTDEKTEAAQTQQAVTLNENQKTLEKNNLRYWQILSSSKVSEEFVES